MPGDGEVSTSSKKAKHRDSRSWLDVFDVFAKLLGAIAILVVAYIANSFQSRLTGVNLQSQREQAESTLRANMFNSLIGPFVGSEKGTAIGIDQEKLLVELLVLNFNEDFEAKPLMERLDKRLANESAGEKSSLADPDGMRESLRSIARRVADRQISSIRWPDDLGKHSSSGCKTYWLDLKQIPTQSETTDQHDGCVLQQSFKQLVSLKSPDNNSTLDLLVRECDWHNETVKISLSARSSIPGQDQQTSSPILYNFTLTWYDLPLTDNTVLADGNRFAINLRAVNNLSPEDQGISIRIIWFPPGYFTPREHPLDYQQILRLLGH